MVISFSFTISMHSNIYVPTNGHDILIILILFRIPYYGICDKEFYEMPSVWKQPLPLHLEVESEVNMLSARMQNHHGMSVVDTVKAIIIVV